ncbi:hypothetical protein K1T71_002916 [Dendrolimus kikuchii]|uniref:Uncharacterized protein n=1 Tax=Dendrolimus kikuchii TaxID=765133 RepID=A0ACC1DAK0_9NEOP|nr:hypothetical protein K1T71_002916 [Dendrolimus kikuchii]
MARALKFVPARSLQWFIDKFKCPFSSCPYPSALEPQCNVFPTQPSNEQIQEHRVGTAARDCLSHELTVLCRCPDTLPIIVGAEHSDCGDCRIQAMPFDHRRVAAYFYHAYPDVVGRAMKTSIFCQRGWERTPVDKRCCIFERAADLLSGEYRQRVIAAAILGQGMTAIQAERNMCQLIDYIRFGCAFMRDLTKSRCVVSGGKRAVNQNQYHGLEGFWAAITPYDSFALAGQLVTTPAITGNCVLWKPSDYAILVAHRILEVLLCAGLPPGVINLVPAEENMFLDSVCSNKNLAGISFGGTTRTLECIHSCVGENVKKFARFPRIVGTGSGKNFHLIHSSANIATAVACTARAAFEMAGQKSSSCSRVFVADFTDMLTCVAQSLAVCHPLDYRCFMSALASQDAYVKATTYLQRALCDEKVQLLCGGRSDSEVGYYVEPTMFYVPDNCHELLIDEIRAPILAIHGFPDCDLNGLITSMSQAPYSITGSIFAQEVEWTKWAIGATRDFSTTLYLNDRCSEEQPGQQSVGGGRKSGLGSKVAGSISYLLQFLTERSLKETLQTCSDVTYAYMNECPPCYVFK